MSFYRYLRPVFFSMDPERIHSLTLSALGMAGRIPPVRRLLHGLFTVDDPRLNVEVGGLIFPNPVGLAAGFDKNGVALDGLAAAGFGFLEVGSVSAYPSTGNPERPRLFRIPEDEAIVVYYGVPNEGSTVVAERCGSNKLTIPLGINLVETNTGCFSSSDEVVEELIAAILPFLGLVDYVTLNLNCPNTSSGRSPFDNPDILRSLLAGYARYETMPPTFLKVVPTTNPSLIDRTLSAMDDFSFVKGVVFGLPTGKPYRKLKTSAPVLEAMPGTLCGRPTLGMINASIRAWYTRIDRERHVIVGTGGIFTAEDAYEKIRQGATLVQLYTALIYHGPGLVKQINRGLCRLMARDGFDDLADVVGVDNRS